MVNRTVAKKSNFVQKLMEELFQQVKVMLYKKDLAIICGNSFFERCDLFGTMLNLFCILIIWRHT